MLHQFYANSDLAQFGVVPLTREACPYGQRVLCDVTATGRQYLENFLGVQLSSPNMNHGSYEDPHVASFMLPLVMVTAFVDFASWQLGAKVVVVKYQTRSYYDSLTEEQLAYFARTPGYEVRYCPINANQPMKNGRNIPAMEHICRSSSAP